MQLFDYLKYRGDRLGLLVNMGLDRVHVERIAYDRPDTTLYEDWSFWAGRISGQCREVGAAVRGALREVYREHETGYGRQVTEKLIVAAWLFNGLRVTIRPIAPAFYNGVQLHQSPLDCIVIENCLVLTFTALFEDNKFNIQRGKSYMKTLGLNWGIAANFGEHAAEFNGLVRRARF